MQGEVKRSNHDVRVNGREQSECVKVTGDGVRQQDRAQLETGTVPLFLYIKTQPTDEEHIPIKTSTGPWSALKIMCHKGAHTHIHALRQNSNYCCVCVCVCMYSHELLFYC